MKIVVNQDGPDDWGVWAGLPDSDPATDAFGFCIGVGATRDEAVAWAVKALEAAAEKLQEPAGLLGDPAQEQP
jgi:hypothetical protein